MPNFNFYIFVSALTTNESCQFFVMYLSLFMIVVLTLLLKGSHICSDGHFEKPHLLSPLK